MNGYSLSRLAKSDLREIARYTRGTWGNPQARRYIVKLREFCQALAETPGLGRPVVARSQGLKRIEHGSHVLFYRETESGVLILRILHQRMLLDGQTFEES